MTALLLRFSGPYDTVPYWAVHSAKRESCSRLTEGLMDCRAASKSFTSIGRILSAATLLTVGPSSLHRAHTFQRGKQLANLLLT